MQALSSRMASKPALNRPSALRTVVTQACAAAGSSGGLAPAAATARPEGRELAHLTAVALAAPSIPAAAPSPAIDRSDRAYQRHGPAREGPPLVLLKHAFLI